MNHDEYEGLARALFEEAHEAQFLLDPETGHVLDANAAAQRLCSLSLRALLNTTIGELFQTGVGMSALEFPMSTWKVDRPYAEWGCLLHPFPGVSVPVDLTVIRLIVNSRPLALLRAREADLLVLKPDPTAGRSRLRHMLATVPGCLWCAEITTAGDSRFCYLSPGIQQVAGRPAEYFGGQLRRWRDLIHPQDQSTWNAALRQRRGGRVTQDEYRIVWPDGSVRWIQDQARAVRALVGPVWLYGVFTDITSRKQAEVSIRRLAELVHTAEDAIIVQTLDGLIVDWNRGAEHLYGYTKEEIQFQPVDQLFASDSVPAYAEAVDRLRRGERIRPYEAVQIAKDGQQFLVSMRISLIGEECKQPGGIAIIARCISGRDSHPVELEQRWESTQAEA